MGNNSNGNGCAEFVRTGDKIFIYDAKNYNSDPTQRSADAIGPLAVYSREDFTGRVQAVVLTGNPTWMFDRPEQYATLTDEEMDSVAGYAGAGLLGASAFIEDGSSVIARASRSDITEATLGTEVVAEAERYIRGDALVVAGPPPSPLTTVAA